MDKEGPRAWGTFTVTKAQDGRTLERETRRGTSKCKNSPLDHLNFVGKTEKLSIWCARCSKCLKRHTDERGGDWEAAIGRRGARGEAAVSLVCIQHAVVQGNMGAAAAAVLRSFLYRCSRLELLSHFAWSAGSGWQSGRSKSLFCLMLKEPDAKSTPRLQDRFAKKNILKKKQIKSLSTPVSIL